MMRSLFSGVSGLENHQTRMDVIGNNIANVNTTGFKGSSVTFDDILSQTITGASSASGNLGGTDAKQIGLGVGISSIDGDFSDGSVESTGVNTQLCLSGSGFFQVANGNQDYYTRDGSFKLDASGNYVNAAGLKVQGWMADSTGKINANSGATSITIPSGQTMAATATTKGTYSGNLSANATSGTTATTGLTLVQAQNGLTTAQQTAVAGLASGGSYAVDANTTISYNGTNYTKTVTGGTVTSAVASFAAYDSQGVKHVITGTLTKSTTTNQWTFAPSATTDTGAAITGGAYTINFNSNGTYSGATGTPLSFSPSSVGLGGATDTISLDFSSLTQYSGDTTAAVDKDGNTAGTLTSISLDSSGTIVGSFNNGLKKNLAQVAVATFNNPEGLTTAGGNLYNASNNSGAVKINTAGNGGAGSITPSSLEMSNVNLSAQFSDMIITQRGFQANSKIITVSDDMLQTLISMKQN